MAYSDIIEYGKLSLDFPPTGWDGLVTANNVFSFLKGYKPVRLGVALPGTNTITGTVMGAFGARYDILTIFFAGTLTKLFKLNLPNWQDVSNPSGYNTSPTLYWTFAQFGNRVLATNYIDPVQAYNLVTSTMFETLAGNPPLAKTMAVVGDFLMLGNVIDFEGVNPNRVHWSGLNNEEIWNNSGPGPIEEAALNAQSDFQSLEGGGNIQRIIGGERGIILMDEGIYTATIVGPPYFFQFDRLEKTIGTKSPQGAVQVGQDVYYVGLDGFYKFNGIESVPIGYGWVDDYFRANADQLKLPLVVAAHNQLEKLIFWTFRTTTGSPTSQNSVLIYNYVTDRWTTGDFLSQYIFTSYQPGYNLDNLDIPLPGGVDGSGAFTVDEDTYAGGQYVFAGFTPGGQVVQYNGPPLEGTIITGEQALSPDGLRTYLNGVRPITEGGKPLVQIGTRDDTNVAPTFTASITANGAGQNPGEYNCRSDARFMRMKIIQPAGTEYTNASGFMMDISQEGKR